MPQKARNGKIREPASNLTAREREIAILVAQGLKNREIAERLSITEHTVKVHLSNTFAKLGVSDRLLLALWARKVGLV